MTAPKCPGCGGPMWIVHEFCGYCDACMIVKFLPRKAFNKLKAEAMKFNGDEDVFVAKYVFPMMARRAYQAVKKRVGDLAEAEG